MPIGRLFVRSGIWKQHHDSILDRLCTRRSDIHPVFTSVCAYIRIMSYCVKLRGTSYFHAGQIYVAEDEKKYE